MTTIEPLSAHLHLEGPDNPISYSLLYSLRVDFRMYYGSLPTGLSQLAPADEPSSALSLAQLANEYLEACYTSCGSDLALIEQHAPLTNQQLECSKALKHQTRVAKTILHCHTGNSLKVLDDSALTAFSQRLEALKAALQMRVSPLHGENLRFGKTVLATFINDVAGCYVCLNRPINALDLHRQALALDEQNGIHNNSCYIFSLRQLAYSLNYAGKLQEAEKLRRQLVMLSDDPISKARNIANLSSTLRGLGKLQEAMATSKEALALFEQVVGAEEHFVGGVLNELALCLDLLGKPLEALSYFEKARVVFEKCSPGWVVNVKLNVANCLRSCGKLEEATTLLLQVLEENERRHGKASLIVATTLINLANCFENLGQYKKVIEARERAQAIYARLFDEHSPSTIMMLCVSANSLSAFGKAQKANHVLAEAKTKALAAHGPDHPVIATISRLIAIQHYSLGEYEQALKGHLETLSFYEDRYGVNHYERAHCLRYIANCYSALGSIEKALTMQQQAVGLYKNIFGSDHQTVALCFSDMGSYYTQLGKPHEALSLYTQASEIFKKLLVHTAPAVAVAVSCVELCRRIIEKPADEPLEVACVPKLTVKDNSELVTYVKEYLNTQALGSLTLKKNPTGFIRIHLPPPQHLADRVEVVRINYWFPDVPIQVIEAPHSHPRYFESIVVQGGYTQALFRSSTREKVSAPHRVHRIFKAALEERHIFCMGTAYLEPLGQQSATKGASLAFPRSLIHQVVQAQPHTLTINCVFKDMPEVEYFDVFMPNDSHVDPQLERESLVLAESAALVEQIKGILNK